jgi:hypothetical protein
MQYALATIVSATKTSQKIGFPHGGSFSTSLSMALEITSALYAEVTRHSRYMSITEIITHYLLLISVKTSFPLGYWWYGGLVLKNSVSPKNG